MNDMSRVIAPKSDQLNADDMLAGPKTIRISRVNISGGPEQPVSIFFDGDGGKPYKPCKSMCRVMVQAWGADSSTYVGRSMTLYRDPKVKWGGMEVGGIRISHMSNIDRQLVMSLTETKGRFKPFTVNPLKSNSEDDILFRTARDKASQGSTVMRDWWATSVTKAQSARLKTILDELKALADQADREMAGPAPSFEDEAQSAADPIDDPFTPQAGGHQTEPATVGDILNQLPERDG